MMALSCCHDESRGSVDLDREEGFSIKIDCRADGLTD